MECDDNSDIIRFSTYEIPIVSFHFTISFLQPAKMCSGVNVSKWMFEPRKMRNEDYDDDDDICNDEAHEH